MRIVPALAALTAALAAVAWYYQGFLAALGWIAAALSLGFALAQKREAKRARRRLARASPPP